VKSIALDSAKAGRAVLHLSCHSFTPVLDGKERQAEIGLLYDPARNSEAAFSHELRKRLKFSLPGWRIRMNYPYRGTSDGVTSWLRESLSNEVYTGIEIELNQAFAAKPAKEWAQARKALTQAIIELTRLAGPIL
jgi:predicted N-formylglutamate amidohydrolase